MCQDNGFILQENGGCLCLKNISGNEDACIIIFFSNFLN